MRKYTVKTAFAYLTYKNPDKTLSLCETADELLYGFEVESTEKITKGHIFVTTDYGYNGYIKSEYLSEDLSNNRAIVSSYSADLLLSPEYKYPPVMTLSKGSIVSLTGEYERFYSVKMHDGKTLYIRKENVIKEPFFHTQRAVTEIAKSYIGTPYRWGGKSSFGIDCSGLCFMSYRMCGVTVSRDSVPDERLMQIVDKNDIQVGDILHFKNHVALYLGEDEFVHSNSKDGFVTLDNFKNRTDLRIKYASRPKTVISFHL